MSYTIVTHNVIDDSITERNMTAEEIAARKAEEALWEEEETERKSKAARKAALLDRLGLTEDDAKLLVS